MLRRSKSVRSTVIVSVIDADNNRQNVRKTVTVVRGNAKQPRPSSQRAPRALPPEGPRSFCAPQPASFGPCPALQGARSIELQGEGTSHAHHAMSRGRLFAVCVLGALAGVVPTASADTTLPVWTCRASAVYAESETILGTQRVEPVLANGFPSRTAPDSEVCATEETGVQDDQPARRGEPAGHRGGRLGEHRDRPADRARPRADRVRRRRHRRDGPRQLGGLTIDAEAVTAEAERLVRRAASRCWTPRARSSRCRSATPRSTSSIPSRRSTSRSSGSCASGSTSRSSTSSAARATRRSPGARPTSSCCRCSATSRWCGSCSARRRSTSTVTSAPRPRRRRRARPDSCRGRRPDPLLCTKTVTNTVTNTVRGPTTGRRLHHHPRCRYRVRPTRRPTRPAAGPASSPCRRRRPTARPERPAIPATNNCVLIRDRPCPEGSTPDPATRVCVATTGQQRRLRRERARRQRRRVRWRRAVAWRCTSCAAAPATPARRSRAAWAPAWSRAGGWSRAAPTRARSSAHGSTSCTCCPATSAAARPGCAHGPTAG